MTMMMLMITDNDKVGSGAAGSTVWKSRYDNDNVDANNAND